MAHPFNPHYDIVFGPNSNCTLASCPVKTSVYEYRPSLGGNLTFLFLFAIGLLLHTVLAYKWRTFAFGFAMAGGCVNEIVGYVGRILLWQNPFSFPGFLMQISEYWIIPDNARKVAKPKRSLYSNRTNLFLRRNLSYPL